jgi:hypothetical protein
MTQVVSTLSVFPLNNLHTHPYYFIGKMRDVLTKQGQIEPLQVEQIGESYYVFEQDTWGSDLVYAARSLGWPTLLISVTKRYEA